MPGRQFSISNHLDRLHDETPRTLAFDLSRAAGFPRWQAAIRAKLRELFHIDGREVPGNPEAEQLECIERDGYAQIKWSLDVGESVRAPVFVLVPDTPPPHKPVMVFHGHNPSVQYILGNYPDEDIARSHIAKDNNYAQALAQAGYLVCAVEQRGFGERDVPGDLHRKHHKNSCRHTAFNYMALGRSLAGERCWDGMCAISFLRSRYELAGDTLGCTGNSGGGTTTLFLSALDDRVSCVVGGSNFSSYRSALESGHCECKYIPDFLHWFELGDVAAAIAPRPMRFINGELDPIVAIDAAREQFRIVERAYSLLGVPEHADLAVHPEGHRYRHDLAREWFDRWL